MRSTKQLLAVGFGLAVALMSSAVVAQRGGAGGGSYRGGSHYYGGGARYHSGGHYYSGGHSHSSVHFGFAFGGPLWYGPAYYPYAYPYPYYYPPAVVVPQGPRVYVERDDQAMAYEQSSPYWYYCRDSNLYYPYARECAGPWERVPAQPQTPER